MGQYRSVNGRMEWQIKRQRHRGVYQMVHFPNGKCSIIRQSSEIGHGEYAHAIVWKIALHRSW